MNGREVFLQRVITAFFGGLAILLISSHPAQAWQYTLDPSISFQETYDDNSDYSGDDDFEHLLSPSLRAAIASDTTSLDLAANLSMKWFSRRKENDRTDQDYSLGLKHQLSERLGVSLSGGVRLDTTFDDVLAQEAKLAEEEDRITYRGGAGLTFTLTERSTLGLNYGGSLADYEGGRYGDQTQHNLGVTGSYQFTERLGFNAGLSGNISETAQESGDIDQRSFQGSLGISYSVSELWSASIHGGWGRTWSEVDNEQEDSESSSTYLGGINFAFRQETWSTGFGYTRDYYVGVEGENTTRDNVSANFHKQLFENLSLSIQGAYLHAETDGLVLEEENETWSAGAGLAYQFWPNASARIGYEWRRKEDLNADETDTAHRVYLGLTFAYPMQY